MLNNKDIRQAINFAIDRQRVVAEVYSNKKSSTNFILPQNNWLYNQNLSYSNYNTEKAKQILTDNGWSLKSNVLQKTIDSKTYKLNLNLLVNAEDENRVKVSELIKQNLEDINVNVTINKVSSVAFKEALNDKNYDIALIGVSMSASPNLISFLGENNYANYENSEIKKYISNNEELKENYNKIQEILKEDTPYIPLYYNQNIVAYNEKISGNITPTWLSMFYNFDSWQKEK